MGVLIFDLQRFAGNRSVVHYGEEDNKVWIQDWKYSYTELNTDGGNDRIEIHTCGNGNTINSGDGDDYILIYDSDYKNTMTIIGGKGNDVIRCLSGYNHFFIYENGDGDDTYNVGYRDTIKIVGGTYTVDYPTPTSHYGGVWDICYRILRIGNGSISLCYNNPDSMHLVIEGTESPFNTITNTNRKNLHLYGGNCDNLIYNGGTEEDFNSRNSVMDLILNEMQDELDQLSEQLAQDFFMTLIFKTYLKMEKIANPLNMFLKNIVKNLLTP